MPSQFEGRIAEWVVLVAKQTADAVGASMQQRASEWSVCVGRGRLPRRTGSASVRRTPLSVRCSGGRHQPRENHFCRARQSTPSGRAPLRPTQTIPGQEPDVPRIGTVRTQVPHGAGNIRRRQDVATLVSVWAGGAAAPAAFRRHPQRQRALALSKSPRRSCRRNTSVQATASGTRRLKPIQACSSTWGSATAAPTAGEPGSAHVHHDRPSRRPGAANPPGWPAGD